MKASELIMRLQALQHHQGDLDIAVFVTSEDQVFALKALVEADQFDPNGPHYLVLETEGPEL